MTTEEKAEALQNRLTLNLEYLLKRGTITARIRALDKELYAAEQELLVLEASWQNSPEPI